MFLLSLRHEKTDSEMKVRMVSPATASVTVLCSFLWTCIFGQEPAYQDIVYGGAWKHVTINPSKEYTDVGRIEKKLFSYMQKSDLFLVTAIDGLECYIMINLLYSMSDDIPLLLSKEFTSNDGSVYSVSVPISTGAIYHCEAKTTQQEKSYVHYITATTLTEEDSPIFIYSHIFFSSYELIFTALHSLPSQSHSCQKQINTSTQFVLSSLARGKKLYSMVCFGQSEMTKVKDYIRSTFRKVDHHNKNEKSSFHETKQLKVMSYNIWNFNPYFEDRSYSTRIKRLTQTIIKTNPDIIGLQEVRLEALKGGRLGPSQVDHLVPHLKQYQYVFQPAQMFESSLQYERTEEGVAILSKFPIVYHDYLLLFRNKSNSADSHQRVCLHAVISVPDVGMIHIFNTHYSLSHEAREKASQQILQFMNQHEGPAIVLGDFNATPEEKAIRIHSLQNAYTQISLRGNDIDASPNTGIARRRMGPLFRILLNETNLIDSWVHLHKEPGYTFNTLEKALSKRIDYILMRALPDVNLTDVTVVADNTRSNVCSDHRAVLATMSFKTCH